jgi:hypothetical protein
MKVKQLKDMLSKMNDFDDVFIKVDVEELSEFPYTIVKDFTISHKELYKVFDCYYGEEDALDALEYTGESLEKINELEKIQGVFIST